MALQDHYSYKAPTTNHHIKQNKICGSVVQVGILWFLVAVHFISNLMKFDLIITIFEQNLVYQSPILSINVFSY